jgi:hypothetical protein
MVWKFARSVKSGQHSEPCDYHSVRGGNTPAELRRAIGLALLALLATIAAIHTPSARPRHLLSPGGQRAPGQARQLSEAAFSPGAVVVHGANGRRLDRAAFHEALPRMIERYVGDRDTFEPSIGVGPDGTGYYLAGGGDMHSQENSSASAALRSTDNGKTWDVIGPPFVPVDVPAPLREANEEPLTGDPYMHVDPVTGRVFVYNQQTHLLCDSWDISADHGNTWSSWETCSDPYSWGDHPTITTGRPRVSKTHGYRNVVYFCSSMHMVPYAEAVATSAEYVVGCRASLDGGMTFGLPVEALRPCENDSNGPSSTARDGTLYVPCKGSKAAWVGISRDDGKSFKTVRVDKTVWTHPNKYQSADPEYPPLDHEASVAADAVGNVYFFWLGDDSLPYLSISRDRGNTWSRPLQVRAPGITAAQFPKIVAGDRGRIAFMYMGSNVAHGFEASPKAMAAARWNAYIGYSVNALARSPVFATATANPVTDPLKRGTCAWRCTVSQGPLGRGILQDGVYDFLDIDINPRTGFVWVSLVDLCNDACARDPSGEGAYGRSAVGIQIAGPRMLNAR